MKLGQIVTVKNKFQSLKGMVVCITKEGSDTYSGDTLLYFDNDVLNALNLNDICDLNITFCLDFKNAKHIFNDAIETILEDDLIAIDNMYFTNDKNINNYGWVFNKYIVEENEIVQTSTDDLKFTILFNNRTCSRCNNNFSETGNGGGKICFKCGLWSSDPIYNQTK